MLRVAWVTPWKRVCGIADYSRALESALQSAFAERNMEWVCVDQDQGPDLLTNLAKIQPHFVFFQHEYGLWGGKNPPFYRFPRFVAELRKKLPTVRVGATAHTVLPIGYRFPTQGRGWQVPFRAGANILLIERLRRAWGADTWGGLDLVVVHSGLQVASVEEAGAARVAVIPHFVPELGIRGTVSRGRGPSSGGVVWPYPEKRLLVFGFLTPEKGQDIAIQLLSFLPSDFKLIIAGGVRRKSDRAYEMRCRDRIRDLGLESRVEWAGYVPSHLVDSFYARAHLVLAPFRETTGSGSLAQGFARGAAILASDLPLNREIAQRVSGSLAFFKPEDAQDGASQVLHLFENEERILALRSKSREYATLCSASKIARQYAEEIERVR